MKQPINRLLMLRARNLCGPFFQRIGVHTLARSAGNYLSIAGFSKFEVSDGAGAFEGFEVADGAGGYIPFEVRG